MFDNVFFDNLLKGKGECYYAHLPKSEQSGRRPELLSEHSALTVSYANKIVEAHNLEGIIKKLAEDSVPKKLNNRSLIADIIEDLFWKAIAFHDLGKINHEFQQKRMGNNNPIVKVKHSFGSQHSIISAYLHLALFFYDFQALQLSDEEQMFLINAAFYLCNPIIQHHSSTIGKCQNENEWSEQQNGEPICGKEIEKLRPYLQIIDCQLNDEQIGMFHEYLLGNTNHIFETYNQAIIEKDCGFPLYALIKLLYSLLTAADYLATAHYMNGWQNMISDFGILGESTKNKIVNNARNSKPYNKQTYSDIAEGKTINPDDFKERNGKNLNTLREALAIDVIKNVKNNLDKRLFYIEAPTGGGKTNVSMLALSELLTAIPTIQKVFYVFPFTTLITQTFKCLKETLGLEDGELMEFHSKAPKNTGRYEDDYLNYIDTLFLNFPIVLLSHVSFFNVLKTNEKDRNYLVQRLSHSVVIIDEVQSYPPKIWDKMVYFIANYAKYFDIRFILMSATLPKIGELIENKSLGNEFVYLVNNKNLFFQNPNFANRVDFDYSLLQWAKPDKDDIETYLERLGEFVDRESKLYAETNTDNPDSVFTVVEFIFKKSAGYFYEIMQRNTTCFDEIMLLSGTILEPRRKQIINALKSDKYRSKKILLVTTQVVEAGVDIDMDLGFKDKSLIDSEEQIAGRINRNANKKNCKLYIFDCNAEKTIYGSDDRYKFVKEFVSEEYQKILETKDFDYLYDKIIERIKQKNKSQFMVNLKDMLDSILKLDCTAVNNSFEIIDRQNRSIFIPLEINTNLIDNKLLKIAEEFGLNTDTALSGQDVWTKYEEIIKNQDVDFVSNRIMLDKIQSLMSQFTISIFPESKDYDMLKIYGEEKYGYLFLHAFEEIYSFENGINTNVLQHSNFL